MTLLLRQIILPLARRLGTLAGAFLTSQQIPSDDVTTIVAAIPVLVGVLIDIGHSRLASARGWS